MITERHAGKNEKTESFSGMRFRIAHPRIRILASVRKKAKEYSERGYLTKIEKKGQFYRLSIRRAKGGKK
jgi:hypothetical protein